MTSLEVIDALQQDIAAVEGVLARMVRSRVAVVESVGRHTLEAGGKRLRPAFLVLAARATGQPFRYERAVELGASMELIHMATLIHDDIIDHAATRRGRPTAATVYGNTASILSGDVLLAQAMALLAADGDIAIIRRAAQSVVEMAEGEAREVETRGVFDLSIEDHLEILRMKTATFIECCCRIGARLSEPSWEEAFGVYGQSLGLCFQIVDDLLDYQAPFETTGKPRGTDFLEGCATLPLILLRERLSESEEEFVREIFGGQRHESEFDMLVAWMNDRGVFDQVRAMARAHGDAALSALSGLPNSPDLELLRQTVEFVLARDR